MSFCMKCGTQNEDGSKFCSKCGAPMVQASVGTETAPKMMPRQDADISKKAAPMQTPKKKSPLPMIIALAGVLAAAMGVVIFMVVFGKPTINLNNYLVIEADGYDGYGRASARIDWDAIDEKYGEKLKFTSTAEKEYEGLLDWVRPIELIAENVSGNLSETEGLSNGDEITYTWSVQENLSDYVSCKVKYKDYTYKVSELTEVGTFDVFALVDVSFDGVAPNGYASIDYSGPDLSVYDFSIDNSEGLSNGDEVVVRFDASRIEQCIEKFGKIPETLEKSYTVSGLSSYLTTLSELSDDALSQMKRQAEDVFSAYVAKNWDESETLLSFTSIGEYLLTGKSAGAYPFNRVALVYKAQVRDKVSSGKKSYDEINNLYWFICYDNIMLDGSGNAVFDVTDYKTPSNRFTVETNVPSGWFGTYSWYYYGYPDLQGLYKDIVTVNADSYNHEDRVDESAAPMADVEAQDVPEQIDGDFILPNSDTEYLTEADLEGLDAEECKIARNEIYARHGRKFKDKDLQAYFDSKDWYEGTIDPDDFKDSMLSDIEHANKDLIVKYEEKKGYR